MDEESFPRPLPFLDENDPLIAHYWSLVGWTGTLLHSAWLLAMNQVAAAHEDTAQLLPIGSHDPKEQRGVAFLSSSLSVLRIEPMAYLIEQLRIHAPDFTRVCGKFLRQELERSMRWALRKRLGIEQPPFQWQGEYLTADNPIRVGQYRDGKTIVEIPDDTDTKYYLQVESYLKSFRPVKRPGRPRKSPGASRTGHERQADPRARLAADLKQQGLHWRAIARTLWPDEPLPTEHKAWEALRQRVRRLVNRGLLDALPEKK